MVNYDIVIIDSGINLNNNPNTNGICIQKNNAGIVVSDDLTDEIGHGTVIYSVIQKEAKSAKIYNIKLFVEENSDDGACLIAALDYIKKNISCKLINISLGITISDNLDELYNICAELSANGVVIISAFDNGGCYSYPAAFDCVIGVDSKNDLANISEIDFIENSKIDVFAKGNVQRLTMQDGKVLLIGGSSIACAHITSILYNNIKNISNLRSALEYLKVISRRIYRAHVLVNDIDNKFFKIYNSVVFPFAKEAHAFLRFSNELQFNIQGYYDVKQSGKVGRKLSSYYEGLKSDECIKDIEKIDFSGIDTIILGHLDELDYVLKRDYKTELIKMAIDARVNIFSFDPLDKYTNLLSKSNVKYYYPQVNLCDVPQNTFGKLYKISKPVVGIFGTSSCQGKFSLQMTLKKELEFRGYNVGTIGTEPHSLLFNFDVVFPMGYNSTVKLTNHDIVLFLNNEINNLCLMNKEIILVATQAQIVPYGYDNIQEFPSMQYHFALGSKPDAIVMCINYYDEISYIKKSMYALMGLTDASIIALILYPLTYYNDWKSVYSTSKRKITYEEFKEKSDLLKKEFKIPIYILGDEKQMHELSQKIIDFF